MCVNRTGASSPELDTIVGTLGTGCPTISVSRNFPSAPQRGLLGSQRSFPPHPQPIAPSSSPSSKQLLLARQFDSPDPTACCTIAVVGLGMDTAMTIGTAKSVRRPMLALLLKVYWSFLVVIISSVDVGGEGSIGSSSPPTTTTTFCCALIRCIVTTGNVHDVATPDSCAMNTKTAKIRNSNPMISPTLDFWLNRSRTVVR